jgi:hypothetical protein
LHSVLPRTSPHIIAYLCCTYVREGDLGVWKNGAEVTGLLIAGDLCM